MAIAAAVISTPGDNEEIIAQGSVWQRFFRLTFSGSYTTGGDALDFTPYFPASTVLAVQVSGGPVPSLEYDIANRRLKAYTAANTEHTAAAYNAAVTGDTNIIAIVWGR